MLKQLLCWLKTGHANKSTNEWLDCYQHKCWWCGYEWYQEK